MGEFGAVFYRGPSLLTGEPVVGIATGLDGGSMNAKTGPIAQTWILRPDKHPMEAVRDGSDDAICGDCKLRGEGGRDRKCYVTPFFGPNQVFKQFRAGVYPDVTWPDLQALLEGRSVRLGSYGDPAALPYEIWRTLLTTVASDEAGFRSTCQRCQLCRGTSSPARSVVIQAHGKPATMKAFGIHVPFFQRRSEAPA